MLIVLPFVHYAVGVLALLEYLTHWETLPSLGFLVKLDVSSTGTLLGGWHRIVAAGARNVGLRGSLKGIFSSRFSLLSLQVVG